VDEDPVRYGEELVAIIDLHAMKTKESWTPCRGGLRLRMPATAVQDNGVGEIVALKTGDRLRGWVEWTTPRNYQNPGAIDRAGFLNRRGIYLLGRVKSPRLIENIPGDCRSVWSGITLTAREKMMRNAVILRRNQKTRESAILASLLVGDYSGLDGPTREAFQNSGTYHVLVVSGLHVSWLAGILFLLLRWLRIPQETGRLLVAITIYFYCCVVGFQASITRCLWMLILYLVGQSIFRRADPGNLVLAAGFSLLIFRPEWLFDAGFQLSFLSVLAISAMALPLIERMLVPLLTPMRHAGQGERFSLGETRWHRSGRTLRTHCELLAEAWADRSQPRVELLVLSSARALGSGMLWLGSMLTVSACVQIWIEPILAFYFNRLSWIAPIANLIVVPFSSAVLGLGIMAAIWPGPMASSQFLIELAGQMSALLLGLARWFSGLAAGWQRCPTPALPWILLVIAALLLWCAFRWRCVWLPVLLSLSLLAWLGSAASPAQESIRALTGHRSPVATFFPDESALLRLVFLDVGEGDCIVIQFPNRQCWLVDAGGIRQPQSIEELTGGFDVGEAVVSRYLWHQWILRLDRVLLSHPDLDHAGGIPAVLRNFRVANLQIGKNKADPILANILITAIARKTMLQYVQAGDRSCVGKVRIHVLNPVSLDRQGSTNDNSVVLHLTYDRFSTLLTGDLERAGETTLLSSSPMLDSLLLKVSHHGSRSATLEPFLSRVRPRWAIISVGKNNQFGHPSQEVLLRLLAHRARPLLTSEQGAISIDTDGRTYVLSSHRAGILESGSLQ
jgi:competence protein ComEC